MNVSKSIVTTTQQFYSRQPFSSDPSLQFELLSHCFARGIHSPLRHANSALVQFPEANKRQLKECELLCLYRKVGIRSERDLCSCEVT